MSGPYAGGGWCEDRPTRREAEADMPTPGQLAALLRAANADRARMTPERRAKYDASMGDPWAKKEDR